MAKHKVYVVDYDSCSPLGLGKNEINQSIQDNKSCGDNVTLFNTEGLGHSGAAEVRGNLAALYESEMPQIKEAIKYDRKLELLVANYFLMKPRLDDLCSKIPAERKGIVLGLGLDVSPLENLEEHFLEFSDDPQWSYINSIRKLNQNNSRLNSVLNPLDIYAIYFADRLNLGAFQRTTLTACAASTQAIVYAAKAIQEGEADLVVAGGSDSIINMMAYIAFGKLAIMSSSSEHPGKYCKPLDIARSGALVGEASGLCVLVNEETVKKFSLKPICEILGFGNSLDGYKITAPDPEGLGMRTAIEEALISSGIHPREVDYINLHGTATRSNDEVELQSIINVFGEDAKNVAVSSTKSRHGHAIAAAGIQEFNLLLGCMEKNLIPHTLNLENPIFSDKIDCVIGQNRTKKLQVAMTNNFAFGGVNTVIVIKKV